jgi:4-hydroxy-tetrahydrodipicolinate synthase
LPATIARLVKLPRIVAVKEAVPTMERVRELAALGNGQFTVLSGDDESAGQAMLNGARGVISVTANVAPKAMAQMSAAALGGDLALMERIDAGLRPLHSALFVEGNPIPVKWALSELGLIQAGIRLPLTPLSEGFHARVRAALAAALGHDQASGQISDQVSKLGSGTRSPLLQAKRA